MIITDIISEAKMSPGRLMKFLKSPEAKNVRGGFEAEMVVPFEQLKSSTPIGIDRKVSSIDDIEVLFNELSNEYSVSLDEETLRVLKLFTDRLEEHKMRAAISWAKESFEDVMDELIDDAIEYNHQEEVNEFFQLYYDAAIEAGHTPDAAKEEAERRAYNRIYGLIKNSVRDDYASEAAKEYDDSQWFYEMYGIDEVPIGRLLDDFGFYIPSWPFKSNNNTVQPIIDGLKRLFGAKIHYGKYKEGSWGITRDASIVPDERYDTESGIEIISPVMPISELITVIPQFLEFARSIGAYTNDSTGFHINLSVPGFNSENFNAVKAALLIGDQHILKSFHRSFNKYAASVVELYRKTGDTGGSFIVRALQEGINALNPPALNELHHWAIDDRYVSVNIKDEYIEFRSAGGSYINRPDAILDALGRFTYGLIVGSTPDMARKEYAKKLQQLLSKTIKSDDIINTFIRYNLGEIPISYVKSVLKQRKRKRKEMDDIYRELDGWDNE